MTAPFVWGGTRLPLTDVMVQTIGPETGSTKRRARVHAGLGNYAPVLPNGDLWQREAERDVLVHGEPVFWGHVPPRPLVLPIKRSRQELFREAFRSNIESRRPAMRAARAERT